MPNVQKPTETPAEPAKPANPDPTTAPEAASTSKSSHKTALIIVGVVVAIFVLIPAIALTIGGVFVGKKIADNGVKIDGDNKSVTIKDKDGNEFSAGESQELPKDFPSEVKVYSGQIVSAGRSVVEGKTAWTVAVKTSDSATKVGESLTEQYSNNGWTASMNNTSGTGGLLIATNGKYGVSAFYSSEDGQTAIVYTVTPDEE